MAKVTGIGGIFFKTKDPAQSRQWYREHLGVESEEWGAIFKWRNFDNPDKKCYTVFSQFKEDTEYIKPSTLPFMINLRVDDLEALLEKLKEEGITQTGKTDVNDFGKFAWVIDPDGVKLELWEPPANEIE
ncbi:MAG: VOC family protein [Ignavibacteriaceae bacterium]|nr:VOC family protein [Ignavibacteriaceae bacterium]